MPGVNVSEQSAPDAAVPAAVVIAPPPPGEGWVLAACCLGAATVLGLTLQLTNGTLRQDAIQGLTLALGLSAVGVVAWRLGHRWAPRAEPALAVLLGGALLLQLREWVQSIRACTCT